MAAYLFLREQRETRNRMNLLNISVLGSRGKKESIKEQMGEWEEGL